MSTQSVARGRNATSFRRAFEASFGVTPADGHFVGRFYTNGLQETRGLSDDPVLGEALDNPRDSARLSEDLPDVGGDLVVPLCLNQIGDDLRAVFGVPTSTGSGPYTHVFASGADVLPTFSAEWIRRMNGATPVIQRFTGLGVNTATLTAATARGPGRMSLGLIGRAQLAHASAYTDSTPVDRAFVPILSRPALRIDGTLASVQSCEVTLPNTLTPRNDLDGTEYITGLEAGAGGPSLSLTARYRDETYLDLGLNGTEMAVALTWTVPNGISSGVNGTLTLAFPRVRIERRGAPIEGPDGADLTFSAMALQSADAPAVTATLVNGLAGSEYGVA